MKKIELLTTAIIFGGIGISGEVYGYDSAWELVFNDEFSAQSFSGSNLDWNNGKWNKIDYVNWNVSDWRKYQSRDESLVQSGESNGTDYVTLKGTYGDYTSQSDQSGAADTFACGGIFTDKTFSFQYGYVEVRARFESEQGVWPAIWLMPKSGGWPNAGEIDVMEHVNYQGSVWQTLHLLNNAGSGDAAPSVNPTLSNTNGWHTYGMQWTADRIVFYIDGVQTGSFSASSYTNWPFDDGREFYLLIDQQIGGSWAGTADSASLANNSADFDIDYVRVYSTEKNSVSASDCPTWGAMGEPIESQGEKIEYQLVTNVGGGAIEPSDVGDYSYEVTSDVGRILAEGSNIELRTTTGGVTKNISGDMVQARSLYLSEGRYKLMQNSTVDVDTLFIVGGSLIVGAENALNSVEHLYLGMETDTIDSGAMRNSSLYVSANQNIKAGVTLVDDSKIAVYTGCTLTLEGSIDAIGHTLNLVGVNNSGAANVVFKGENNNITRLSVGVAETTPNGNTFVGGGQILSLQLGEGSVTNVGELVTNTPIADKPSSMSVGTDAVLTITERWQNASANTYNVNIAQGGTLQIGDGSQATDASALSGVQIQNKGLLYVREGAQLCVDEMSISGVGNDSGNRATLKIDGEFSANTVQLDGNKWTAIGTLDVLRGESVDIENIVTGTNGQVDINVRSGHMRVDSLSPGNSHALVIQAETYALGEVSIANSVNNTNAIHVRAGKVNFLGGLTGSGNVQIKNNAVVQIFNSAGNQAISVNADAVLETGEDFNGGTVSGAGKVKKTDSGTATVSLDSSFIGGIVAEAGLMKVSGASDFSLVHAIGGQLCLEEMENGVVAREVELTNNSLLEVYTQSQQVSSMRIAEQGALSVAEGTMSANLVMSNGAMWNVAVDKGFSLQGELMLEGRVQLGGDMLQNLALGNLDTLTLVTGLEEFSVGEETWQLGDCVQADLLFDAEGIDLSAYELMYASTESLGGMGNALIMYHSIPEPGVGVLAFSALGSFLLRRRRG